MPTKSNIEEYAISYNRQQDSQRRQGSMGHWLPNNYYNNRFQHVRYDMDLLVSDKEDPIKPKDIRLGISKPQSHVAHQVSSSEPSRKSRYHTFVRSRFRMKHRFYTESVIVLNVPFGSRTFLRRCSVGLDTIDRKKNSATKAF